LGGEPPFVGLPIDEVRAVADRHLAVMRSGRGLRTVLAALVAPPPAGMEPSFPDLAATLMAWLVAMAALRREESRGGHHRTDHPDPVDEWRVRQAVSPEGWSRLPVEP
jgi:L-aspartate oxidase